jgi:DNA primase
VNLTDLVEGYCEPAKASIDGEYWIRCPFCGDDKRRMGINVNNGLCHCFRASCEWKSDDIRRTFREISKALGIDAEQDRFYVRKKVKPKRNTTKFANLPKEFENFSDLDDEVTRKAYEYLTDRGVTDKQIKKHKLGLCAVGDYAYRIIIPVFRKGKLLTFTSRDFTDQSPLRYKNHPGPKYLFNMQHKKKAILLEGPFDVLAVERATDEYDVVGRLGAGMTAKAIHDLSRYDEIIVWPDPDRGGIQLAIDTCKAMAKRGKKMYVIMPKDDDVDPGKLGESEAGLEEIREKIEDRVKWSESTLLKLKSFSAFSTIKYGDKKTAIL